MDVPGSLNEHLYQLTKDTLGHWWKCIGCQRERGPYTRKQHARTAAERHHDQGKCTREYL